MNQNQPSNQNPSQFSNQYQSVNEKSKTTSLRWIFFSFMLLTAIGSITISIFATLCCLTAALLLYPPLKNFLIAKLPFLAIRSIRIICILSFSIIGFVSFGISSDSNKKSTPIASEQPSRNTNTQNEENTQTTIEVGTPLKTKYFEITVNRVELGEEINTGNQFVDLPAEDGIRYLIINATFKNIDNESRMIFDGSVWITYNGKLYEFDKSEVVMLDGWGVFLDQINPLTKKTTNLVYKIPSEITGKAYWQPGRTNSDEKIFLGDL